MLKLPGGDPGGRLKLQMASERNHVKLVPIHIGRAHAKRNLLGKVTNDDRTNDDSSKVRMDVWSYA